MIRRNQGKKFGLKKDKVNKKFIVTYAEEPW